MDNTIDTTKERLSVLDQPPTSHTSFVLNGMGNGAMLAATPFAAAEVLAKITGKPLLVSNQQQLIIGGVFASVVGAAIGAWHGNREAKNLTAYQTAVSEEIRKLRTDVDAHAQAHYGRA